MKFIIIKTAEGASPRPMQTAVATTAIRMVTNYDYHTRELQRL